MTVVGVMGLVAVPVGGRREIAVRVICEILRVAAATGEFAARSIWVTFVDALLYCETYRYPARRADASLFTLVGDRVGDLHLVRAARMFGHGRSGQDPS